MPAVTPAAANIIRALARRVHETPSITVCEATTAQRLSSKTMR